MEQATVRRGSAHPSVNRPTPARNEDFFEPEELAELRDYVKPLRRVRRIRTLLSTVVDLWLVFGFDLGPKFTGWVDGSGWFVQLVVLLVVWELVTAPLTLPFDYWVKLVYEKRAGHSTTTVATWVKDQVLQSLLGTAVVLVMLGIMYWAVHSFDAWWLIAGALVVGVLVVVQFLSPVLIMPRFNKFTPLEPGPIRDRILEIAALSGVTVRGAYLMDASKRTSRANAGVTGFGKTKRVVVNDTICDFPLEELSQVIAHELGHYRLNHILTSMPVSMLELPVMFAFVQFVLGNDTVLGWAGVSDLGDPASAGVVAFGFMIPGLLWSPLQHWISRKHEREADLEALELLGDPTSFVAVWPRVVLNDKANMEPTWWERVTSTHPEIAERMQFGLDWARMNDVPVTPPPRRSVATLVAEETSP